MVPQQVVYQPQPIQYVQQPLQYTPQPIQYRPVQYVPQYQYQPQQPIQYQPQPVQYVPAVQKFIPIKMMNEPETLPEPEIVKHKIVAEQMKPEQFESEEIDSELELEDKYTSAKDEQLIATVLRTAPSRAVLLSARGANGRDLLKNRLPSNYTTTRADNLIRDTFSCNGKIYGYYAD